MSRFGFASRARSAVQGVTKRQWTAVAVVVVLVTAAIIAFSLRPADDPLASDDVASIKDRGVLRVGIRNDVPGFGGVDADGNPAGFEVDLAKELASRIFGTAEVEFTVVNFSTLAAKLKDGQIDCAFAVAQTGMSTSLTYSSPYYTDASGLMVPFDSTVQSPSDLAGLSVGCVNRDGSNMRYSVRNDLKTFAAAQSPACMVVEFAGSADMLRAMSNGQISAVCLEYSLLYSFYSPEAHRILPDAIGTISYSVACPPDKEALAAVANTMISDIRSDGTLTGLLKRWGLRDYSS